MSQNIVWDWWIEGLDIAWDCWIDGLRCYVKTKAPLKKNVQLTKALDLGVAER